MKSLKKLLVSASLSATLCSSYASAWSSGATVGVVASGVTLTTAMAVGLPWWLSGRKNNLSPKEELEVNVDKAKKKIVSCIGKEKYNILKNVCDKYAVYDDYEFEKMNKNIKMNAVSVKIKAGDVHVSLSSKSEISAFWSGDNQNIPIKEISRELFKYCFYPVASGISFSVDKYFEIFKAQDNDEWGNGFESRLNDMRHLRHLVFVSNDYKRIKLCFRKVEKEKVVLSADVILDVEQMNLRA